MSDIEVIGAGWGRTGTTSLMKALEILGYNPCYHMRDVLGNNAHAKFWCRVADKEKYDFDEVFKNNGKLFKASVDAPSAYYWREQLVKYPNAKVILSLRDSNKWYDSAHSTIFQDNPCFPEIDFRIRVHLFLYDRTFAEMIRKTAFRDQYNSLFTKENVIKCFEDHNKAVVRECPKDQLLVFEASHGWGPLCAFLGKPVPAVPYPHVNDAAEYANHLTRMKASGMAAINIALVAVASTCWCVLNSK